MKINVFHFILSQIVISPALILHTMNIKANFDIHYRQNYEAIFKFCYRMLGSREEALDITQETFIKLHERMNRQGLEIGNTKAWLYKVAGNLCLNELSKNRLHHHKNKQTEASQVEISTPESDLIQLEKLNRVKHAISKLEPKQQMLIMMYNDGLSYREMAEATGIKKQSVGKTLWRIIDGLTTSIKKQENHG